LRRRYDALAILVLVALPFLFFWPVVFGGKTLVPVDNLFVWEPWRSLAVQYGVAEPHNPLLSDLILENYVWKLFIRRCVSAGELPLWNPYLFTGVPFLAAGQHSALYPFSLIFYVMPLARAYGLFTAVQFGLAGVGMYLFLRALGARPLGGLIAGIAYAFSAFMVVSVAFTMMIAAAAWLPWCLLALEMVIARCEFRPARDGNGLTRPRLRDGAPWLVLGAVFLGMQVLAGHVEITYYVLLIMAFYAALRLLQARRANKRPPWRGALLVVGTVVLGLALGAVQLLPLYEFVRCNFRSGAAAYRVTYRDVIGWAYPLRQLVTFLVPDFYGNPSIHRYLDIVTLRWAPITRNALGEAISAVEWMKGLPTWKNYVEAGSYVGILPLLLAVVALFSRRFVRHAVVFTLLALISLLFVFGTPLYRLLFLLPGINQLHTPFRWVFPYTVAVAALAGMGASALLDEGERFARRQGTSLGQLSVAVGGLGLLGLLLIMAWPGPFVRLAERIMATSELTQRAYASAAMLLSYQCRNFLLFFAATMGSGLALLACVRHWSWRGMAIGPGFMALVLVADLFAFGYGFNPKADPSLLEVKPAVVQFLEQDDSPWRFTTFIRPGEKPLNANAGMLYGFEDIRGYDSIIPRQYVDFMSLIEVQDELLYNRIAPLSERESLDSPLLDLLNVKYVLTTQEIGNPGYELVHEGPLRVYVNGDYMPRAFAVTNARRVPSAEMLEALRGCDPREAVLLEERVVPAEPQQGETGTKQAGGGQLLPVSILLRQFNEVLLSVSLPEPGWVVLTDAYFPGWRAYVKRVGTGEQERQVPIERAYGAFRAVELPAGEWELRFHYMPRSFQVGLYVSFISAVALLLILAAWLWSRYYRRGEEEHTVRRVAKNSLTPMMLSLVNKLIDMAFAMLMLRILAPEGAGRYQFAVTFIGYFEILVRFGLGTLVTREVSRDPSSGRRYLSNTVTLRLLLWVASLPVMSLLLVGYVFWSGLTADVVAAVAFFAVSVLLSNIADSFSAIFYAHERMEYPAFVSTATTLTRVTLGAAVLLLGGGFVGLAAVSIVSNLFSASVLGLLLARDYYLTRPQLEKPFARGMVREAFPLMVNHLLATIFFQVDVLLLQPFRGDVEVGYYSAAYRYIRGLDIIPSYFTMALFPVMARYAHSARDSLQRAYALSLRLLFIVSLPIAMGTTFVAGELILLLAGPEYLPHSRLALQILIWFLPIGFINSVTQYVLISLDEQSYLMRAFVIGVSFNVVANLVLIPLYGYRAAALVTVLSEFALLIPFMRRVYRHLEPLSWPDLVWQPAAASLVMGGALFGMRSLGVHVLAMIPVAGTVYVATLLVWQAPFTLRHFSCAA